MTFKTLISRGLITFCFILFACSSTFANAGDGDAILGTWLVAAKDAKVEIFKCGDKYCGKLVWLKKPTDAKGKARTDDKNPDKALQSRTLEGLQMVNDFAYDASDKEWNTGTIYNTRNGKTYSGYMQLQKDGSLYLKGYVMGMRFLGKSQTWTRVEE